MKYLTFIIFSTLIAGQPSCHNKPVATIFESAQKDTATKLGETQVYILKKATKYSDFNYSKLDNIDGQKIDTLNIRNLMPVFEPVSGQYNYYQFLSTFVGEGYNADGPPVLQEFHNILIIKTDTENKIIDAYQYTLEWAEMPLQYDVFKSSKKNITLTNNMNITELKFKRTYSWSEGNLGLNESGIIKLKLKTTNR